ncbi:glycosyltransferase family 39 protein [Paenibacillus zeisoli]|uniref:Glycosyltransferase family 39 protein n=1 Tax=Paenibacillus zeisoli TaxID=2496267 RepID=A0A433XH37_9BACL|nr:glycosyltransferase family 39 protein [Paenibacillus zeisoli]RUT33376.1 glycosyltransferase family 39 protein [Paenibacillus zeisoli]
MFSLSEVSRPAKRFLAVCIALVLVLSCIIVLSYNNYFLLGDLVKRNNDDVKYIHSAKLLLNQGILAYNSGEQPSAFIMPGMPILLAGVMAIFGQDDVGINAFRILQCVMQAFSVYLIFIIGRRVFNTRIALITAAICVLYPPDYFSSGSILSETTFRTIQLLLICLAFVAMDKRKTVWYILIGLLVAVAAYFKPHATLYPAIFFILWWKQRTPWKDIVKYVTAMAAVYILCLLPWWIRNMITFDKFILFTNSGGSPFLLGTRIHGALPPAGFFVEHPEYDPKTVFQGADSSAVTKGLDIIKYGFVHDPLNYIYWYTLGRWVELYIHPFYSRPFWPITRPVMNVLQMIMMAVSMIGLVWALIKHPMKRMLPLLLTLAYFTLIYQPFVAFNRYGYPNEIILFLFAAYLIDQLIVMRHKEPLLKANQGGTGIR